jgi:hypothetical protein
MFARRVEIRVAKPTEARVKRSWAAWPAIVALCLAHGLAIWLALGGREGLNNPWPLWRDDHSLYFHSTLVTRHFLRQTGTTAGYDPSFMAGYAKSVVFPASSTLPELVVAVFGGSRPERAYKLYVLVSTALIPWLIALAGVFWRVRPGAIAWAVLLFLLYVWTGFPINYAVFGMVPYLLAIPLGLAATGSLVRYLDRGGLRWWTVMATLMVLVVLVHLTSAMVVAPTSALAYGAAVLRRDESKGAFSRSRHAGVWAILFLVLALNAFWWLPGLWLASTKGASDFAFAHPEGVVRRLVQIATDEPEILRFLWVLGLPGLVLLARRDRVEASALGGFVGFGFFWGYLAGGFRSLDFLQPGRHTFACYSGLALASGIAVAAVLARIREASRWRIDLGVGALLLFLLGWWIGPPIASTIRFGVLGPIPFLSSQPSPRLLWVVKQVARHVKRGERLLYEEGGFDLPGIPDPFQRGRFSGLLPWKTGVEVIGGPYLHAALTTNFTQFGEGKLFGVERWGRDRFVRYARLYRPSAIVCWSPRARAFCFGNPDLVRVIDDDGTLLFGRIVGFEGATIEGKAEVEAEPGRLRVRNMEAGLDGTVVLRYHSVPCLRTVPPVAWEPVFMEEDPVPFIRLRPSPGNVTLELRFPPGAEGKPGR